ncbi:MAG: hypothetical protein AAF660_15955 [Pseudomonadota bacterium]
MTDKRLRDLASKPPSACEIDELETIAKAHEDAAYRYRSAISLLRWRMNQQDEKARQLG